MARIVGGFASSHSPMLSTPPDKWGVHAERDRARKLLGADGRYHSFDDLLATAPPAAKTVASAERFVAKHAACESAMAELGRRLAAAHVDVAVVIGDDQEELFQDDNMPAFSVYWGEQIMNVPPALEGKPLGVRLSAWGYYDDKPTGYPGAPSLGLHLVTRLIEDGFDVSQFSRQRDGVSMSHAYTFFHRRIMQSVIPMVPVFINTYYPPNQPTIKRCYAFGRALGKAIESWDRDARVAVLASGGLSHFVVDEPLDRAFLAALEKKDAAAITSVPESRLQSGNSEMKNWAALGGAVEHLQMQLLDYVPVYRSEAGTGCAMAFASWS
jgi:hypothetical protein